MLFILFEITTCFKVVWITDYNPDYKYRLIPWSAMILAFRVVVELSEFLDKYMNDYKADYNNGLIPCSATMVVVCLVVIQTTVKLM